MTARRCRLMQHCAAVRAAEAGNERGTQFEAAQIDDDGTLRVTGHHTGPGVSEFFGAAITSYDWAYVIAPDRVTTLLSLLGGHAGDDVLDRPTA